MAAVRKRRLSENCWRGPVRWSRQQLRRQPDYVVREPRESRVSTWEPMPRGEAQQGESSHWDHSFQGLRPDGKRSASAFAFALMDATFFAVQCVRRSL